MTVVEHHVATNSGNEIYELHEEGELFGMVVDSRIIPELKKEGVSVVEAGVGEIAVGNFLTSQSE